MICSTKKCHNTSRPSPGALYCQGCQDLHLARIGTTRHSPVPQKAPPYTDPWRDGPPNVTCPSCAGCYHYGAPVPFVHACPLCAVWLCWEETGETKDKVLRVARKCPVCGVVLQERSGPYGPWWGCTYVKKNHKDNCSGKRKYHDCDTTTVQVPRLGLAVWRSHVWDPADDVDHFAKLDVETQTRKATIEEREKRFKVWLRSRKRRAKVCEQGEWERALLGQRLDVE